MMRLAISTNIFTVLPIEEAFARIAKIGIKNIEIHALHLSVIKDRADAAGEEIKKNGLRVCSVHSTTMNSDFLGNSSGA